jgi:hypothetical protein
MHFVFRGDADATLAVSFGPRWERASDVLSNKWSDPLRAGSIALSGGTERAREAVERDLLNGFGRSARRESVLF